MSLLETLNALQARAPWRSVLSPILKAIGFHVHRSPEETIGAILDKGASAEQGAKLEDALIQHLIVGEKLVAVIEVSDEERAALTGWIDRKRSASNALTAAFPFMLPSGELRAFGDSDSHFVTALRFGHGTAAVFAAKRSYMERKKISRENLRAAVQDDFDEVIGVYRRYVHAYDAVWVPNEGGFVYLLADSPKEAPHDFGRLSLVALEKAIRRPIGQALEFVNLWPAIDGFYVAKDGRFTELAFATDTDSVKHHKARRGTKCLRTDEYHQAGAGAVDELVPYRASVQWTRKLSEAVFSTPEVELPGTSRDIYQADPTLETAVFRHCLNLGDFEFVASKLAQHIE